MFSYLATLGECEDCSYDRTRSITLMPQPTSSSLTFFDEDVHGKSRKRNMSTMPARNYSVIAELPINQSSGASGGVAQGAVFGGGAGGRSTNAIRASGEGVGAAHLAAGCGHGPGGVECGD